MSTLSVNEALRKKTWMFKIILCSSFTQHIQFYLSVGNFKNVNVKLKTKSWQLQSRLYFFGCLKI